MTSVRLYRRFHVLWRIVCVASVDLVVMTSTWSAACVFDEDAGN